VNSILGKSFVKGIAAGAKDENSARKLISTVLLAQAGEDWWEKCVSMPVKKCGNPSTEREAN
jgi:hypothetical protein